MKKRVRNWFIAAIVLLLVGVGLLVLKAVLPEYVDAAGILNECFFLVPLGFCFIALAALVFAVIFISSIVRLCRKKGGAGAAVFSGIMLILLAAAFVLLIIGNSAR